MMLKPRFRQLACLTLLALLAFVALGCNRAFSTGSPDVPVHKSQHMLTGDNLTIEVPEQVTFRFEGQVPEQIHGDLTIGVWTQRHSADSTHDLDSQLESAINLSELLELDASLAP